jgi:hypothetical protein
MPLKQNAMKKLLFIPVAVLMLVSCGGEDADGDKEKTGMEADFEKLEKMASKTCDCLEKEGNVDACMDQMKEMGELGKKLGNQIDEMQDEGDKSARELETKLERIGLVVTGCMENAME